jgi:hypothetical protein
VTEFATGGKIPPVQQEHGDEVPALLSRGCVYLAPGTAAALERLGVTAEALAELNAEVRP